MPLPSRNRLNLRHIGDDFYDKSRKIHLPYFTAFILPNSLDFSRFAIVVSKKTDALSVGRNQLRRQVSAIIQKKLVVTGSSLDIVLSLKSAAKNLSFEELENAVSLFLMSISKQKE